jgi:hypothetical protein
MSYSRYTILCQTSPDELDLGGKNRAAACDAVAAAVANAAATATAAAAAIYGFEAGKRIPAGQAAGLDCLLSFLDSSASPVSEKW